MTKDLKEKRETKEETSPHTPLKEKAKGKREKPQQAAAARARACVRNSIPTFDQVVSRATSTIGCRDLKWLREWFADQVCSEWCDGKGNPIHNWGRLLAVDWRYARVDAARRNPDRVPDARRNGDGCDEVVRPSLSEFMRDFERRA